MEINKRGKRVRKGGRRGRRGKKGGERRIWEGRKGERRGEGEEREERKGVGYVVFINSIKTCSTAFLFLFFLPFSFFLCPPSFSLF